MFEKEKRLFDILIRLKENFPKEKLFAGKTQDVWEFYSTEDYFWNAHYLAYGLMHEGLKPGDKVISITYNIPEWNFLDMAIMMAGGIHVPVYPNMTGQDYEYIFSHSEAKFVFVRGEELYQRIVGIVEKTPTIQKIFTFKNLHGKEHLFSLIEKGKEHPLFDKLEEIKSGIQEDDVATIIYTSGTTGNPKGVMLTHKNILSNVWGVYVIPPQDPNQIVLSFLPLCHIYERMMNYMYQYNGYTIYYLENIGLLADALKETHPHIMTTVPRVLESIHDKIVSQGKKLKGLKKLIFFWALNLGYRFDFNKNVWYKFSLSLARKLVFSKWKDALGGNLDLVVSGGAKLQERLGRVFWAAGLRIMEGYGLTETSPVIAVSNFEPNGIAIGTVGPPLRGVQVRIAEDGEILCKGPNVMKGYYKEPELTREVFTEDGWFKTGDIGYLTPEGQLKITDRKKEIFKTASGKYIVPQIIENMLKESPFIENAMVIGDNKKFVAALISPNYAYLASWCEHKGIQFSNEEKMRKHPNVIARIAKEIEKINKHLADHEKIVKFELTQPWSVATGELTPTLKIKRRVIFEKYKDLIDKIYA
jgi:long-chain acyl-CoA synthetase